MAKHRVIASNDVQTDISNILVHTFPERTELCYFYTKANINIMGGSIALIPSANPNDGPFRGGTVNDVGDVEGRLWTSVDPPVGVSWRPPQLTAFSECLELWAETYMSN